MTPEKVVLADLITCRASWVVAQRHEDHAAAIVCMDRLDVLLDRLNAVRGRTEPCQPSHL